jgi:hypothetical protein
MNQNRTILIVLVLLVIIGGFYFFNKKEAVAPIVIDTQVTQPSASANGEVCYYKETKGEGSTDYAFTSIKYDGNNVSGVINWIPGEKDSLVGVYTGTVEKSDVPGYPNRINILYTASGEGITNKQQEILIIGANDIETAIGEKNQDASGVYRFKDVNNLTYSNQLPKVDCNTVPERLKKNYMNDNSPVATDSGGNGGCYIGGCSGEVCSDQKDVASNCLYKEAFACYKKTSSCTRQSDGQCGWTKTPGLVACLSAAK